MFPPDKKPAKERVEQRQNRHVGVNPPGLRPSRAGDVGEAVQTLEDSPNSGSSFANLNCCVFSIEEKLVFFARAKDLELQVALVYVTESPFRDPADEVKVASNPFCQLQICQI